ncbi:MAG: T9SS type A sorting domain-containing protein [Rhodothermales bacterium]|nr:T9SS type A sorting domain-containing protein [Rhodothermales bacterium]
MSNPVVRVHPGFGWMVFLLSLALLPPQASAQGLGPIPADYLDVRPHRYTYLSASGVDYSFERTDLAGEAVVHPTALNFGPDGRLYVAQENGLVVAYTIERMGPQAYTVTAEEVLRQVKLDTQNHDDDGEPNDSTVAQGPFQLNLDTQRQATGVLVVGTASIPVIYVSSSDPRQGGVGGVHDTDLDTNSGVISRLTKQGNSWVKVDLVRGLPRSEEQHAPNGMVYDEATNILYLATGGITNAGAPAENFGRTNEYALSAAILAIDLTMLEAMPVLTDDAGASYVYDLPTLDDPTRPNVNGIDDPTAEGYDGIDVNDPFGGNDGLNQAKVIPDGPVQLFATGFRNPYDIVMTRTPGREGRFYTVDNGANAGWGGIPMGEQEYTQAGESGVCTNDYDPSEPGSNAAAGNDNKVNNLNGLHYIREVDPGHRYYGGHPNPVRGNPMGAGLYTYDDVTGVFRTSTTGDNPLPADWPPVPESAAYAAECDFRNSGEGDGALANYVPSTNGIAEYTATNFDGGLQGAILSVGMNGDVYIAKLNEAGDQVIEGDASGVAVLFPSIGGVPLDLVAQGDDDPFPGTIWTANYLGESITVFEPMESGGVAIEDGDGMPGSYTLYGNYPNPFDVATTVVFDLPTAANVRLEVFDVLGRRALALPEVAVPAGSNRQLEIQGGELSAGAYVYRLTIRQGADTRILSGGMTVAR